MMIIEQVISAFKHRPIDHINVNIRERQLMKVIAGSQTNTHAFTRYDILDDQQNQGDRT